MPLRCALHARYSSDQQRAASIEGQFRVCRELAEREGWKIVVCYRDAAISGDSVILRPGVQGLLEDARRGLFEAGIVRRIFREFAQGTSPRAIARRLNEDGIPGPRPGSGPTPSCAATRSGAPGCQQRTLHRPYGVEPPALHEERGHRQPGRADQHRRNG